MSSRSPAGREAIYESLGVDTLAVATVSVKEGRESHDFSADELVFEPKMSFEVYRRGQEHPIWDGQLGPR